MKKYLLFTMTLLLIAALTQACKEEPVGQIPTDSEAPGAIVSYNAESLPGGAAINYVLPDDDDLLYVKAVYAINGVEKTATSSIYSDTLKVFGFGTTAEQSVLLYCVDRSGNHSLPVEAKFTPGTPPVQTVFESLTMNAAFGGVQIQWDNPDRAEVAIFLIAADSLGTLEEADVVYTAAATGKFNLRGFDDSPRMFGAYVRDRWDNYSATLQEEHTPLYEMSLDKLLWGRKTLPGDAAHDYFDGTWQWNNMYDGVIGDQGWHTNDSYTDMNFTLDLGVAAQLSRYTLWHRETNYGYSVYTHHNLKKWKVYGSATVDETKPDDYWTGDDWKADWALLAECEVVKPSGEGPVTDEDYAYAHRGFEFDLSSVVTPVRYVRFVVESTWGGGKVIHISELSFWGTVE
ncbi:MAG: DUF5126 domain-containing protein [Bacteroidales bacterium]|nr:DUF5126 domain-containing protein [Bacteroidales bacterium]